MLGSVLPPAAVAAKPRAWLGAKGREAELFTQRPLADLLNGVAPEQLQRTR